MAKILTTTTYKDEIRGRLGVDKGALPDSDIDAASVLPIGEAKVISRVPDYATLVEDDKSYVYAAAICMVAAILAPSMAGRIKKSESDTDYKYENAPVDWKDRAKDLEDEGYSLIDLISTQTPVELPQVGASGPTRANTQPGSPSISSGDILLWPNNVG